MPAVSDAVWSAEDTTPDEIEAALRDLLIARHKDNPGYVPARVLNMIAFVEHAWSGEIANRLRGVGRYHASRTVVLSHEPRRERLAAVVSVASDADPAPGEVTPLRETVIVELGDRHLDDLATIADPLVVTDLPTLLWSPHGHHDALEELLVLGQAVLIDSIEEPVWRDAIDRASRLSQELYVVDLAWLRSTPWRERIAGTFDPPSRRAELGSLCGVTVRHHPDSTVAAMLLVGWLASRLHWQLESSEIEGHGAGGVLTGGARSRDREPDGAGSALADDAPSANGDPDGGVETARVERPGWERQGAGTAGAGRPAAASVTSRCAWRSTRRCRCRDSPGLSCAAPRACACALTAATAACARAGATPTARSGRGRCSAPRAARAASSARAFARRCCAIRPTRQR